MRRHVTDALAPPRHVRDLPPPIAAASCTQLVFPLDLRLLIACRSSSMPREHHQQSHQPKQGQQQEKKEKVVLHSVTKGLSTLLSNSLRNLPDQDSHLSDLAKALLKLWAAPFSLFVLSPKPRRLYREVTRDKFNSRLHDLKKTVTKIAVQLGPAATRLQQVATQLVRFSPPHSLPSKRN